MRPTSTRRKELTEMSNSAVIVTGPGFQDHDVVYTYYRLIEGNLLS